jgi:phospholipase/lecithinase/hemolysin
LQTAVDLNVRAHQVTSRLQSALIEAVESAGAELVDIRPVFQDGLTAESGKLLFVDHCHPTEYGHRLIAEAVMPSVLQALDIGGTGETSQTPP